MIFSGVTSMNPPPIAITSSSPLPSPFLILITCGTKPVTNGACRGRIPNSPPVDLTINIPISRSHTCRSGETTSSRMVAIYIAPFSYLSFFDFSIASSMLPTM